MGDVDVNDKKVLSHQIPEVWRVLVLVVSVKIFMQLGRNFASFVENMKEGAAALLHDTFGKCDFPFRNRELANKAKGPRISRDLFQS